MKTKSLKQSNTYLRADDSSAHAMRIRSLASSTAIETGEAIKSLEEKLSKKQHSHYHVTLA